MAGSHRTGFHAARADLFDDAPYYLATSRALVGEEPARVRVAATVAALGARPCWWRPARTIEMSQ